MSPRRPTSPQPSPQEGEGASKDRVLLGQVGAAQGLKGEVRLISHTTNPADIAGYGPLETDDGSIIEIESLRPAKAVLVARIKGVRDRKAAEALNGTKLYIERERLPETGEGEWYHADLIGLVAISAEGAALGQVIAVQNFGAGDLLEIRPSAGGQTALIPFTQETVPEVDIQAGWLLLVPPEGAFD